MANMHKNARYTLMASARNGSFDTCEYPQDQRGKWNRKPRKEIAGNRKGTPKFGVRDFLER